MKSHLRFMLLLLAGALFLSSCASKDEVAAEDLPAVEVSVVEAEAVEAAVQEAVISEAAVIQEEPAVQETAAEEDAESVVPEESEPETVVETEADELLPDEDLSAEYLENEFIPVEEKPVYIVDVSSYYDDFNISEDDFIAVEVPVSEEVPVLSEEPVTVFVPEEEPEIVAVLMTEEADETDEEPVVLEETVPAMEPLYVPAPREDMKKPVSVISEEQAAAAAEQEREVAVSELEEILAAIPEPEEPAGPVASRSITIRKNDIIEVPYQGNWWVYLGDVNSSAALTFTGRDYVAEKTVFTLRATNEGQALLHFFKQDIIANVMVDDYLEVIVEEAEGVSGKTTLDMFVISQIKPEPVVAEESGDGDEDEPSLNAAGTVNYVQVIEEPAVASENTVSADTEVEDGSTVITSVPLSDAELFAQAQALEATDIEGAVELYKQLVANYPASPYWTKANNRITYINRFYFFKR